MGVTSKRAPLALLTLAVAGVLVLALLRGEGERSGGGERAHEALGPGIELEPGPAPGEPARTVALPETTGVVSARAAPPDLIQPGVLPETTLLVEPVFLVEPVSLLSGAVTDTQGRAVSGLPLHWRSAQRTGWSTTSDAFGAFRVSGLPKGAGELVLGDPASPVAPPRPLELAPGWTELGTIVVPLLGELSILVLDEQDRLVAEALVSGVGAGGGSIDARSDSEGRAHARFLPRGMYRVFASHPDLGRGNTVFEYVPEAGGLVEVRLRRTAPRD